jgi:DNA-binding transcriptional ArsR family regulator
MELQRPFAVIAPTLDGDVLDALAGADVWFTTGQLQQVIADRSVQGIRQALARLVEQGTVDSDQVGQTRRYRLNRDHLAAKAILLVAHQRDALLERINQHIEGWTVRPVYAALFGSAARGQMRVDSDIDLFLIRPEAVADENAWDGQLADLARLITRWTGNDGRILQMTGPEVKQGSESDPTLAAVARDGITVYGRPVRGRARGMARKDHHATNH